MRLKYALESQHAEPIPTLENIREAIDASFERANDGDTIFCYAYLHRDA